VRYPTKRLGAGAYADDVEPPRSTGGKLLGDVAAVSDAGSPSSNHGGVLKRGAQ